MEENLTESNSDLKLNSYAIGFLKETAKWVNFLAIMGFIGIGLIVIVALFAGAIFSSLPNNPYGEISGGVITFTYLLIAALYFFPVLYMYRFADKMKTALARKNEDILTEAFMNLKSHYKFIGILTIVMLSLYALLFLLALIGGLAVM
jgi:FtsH-binding integral membrane protein